MGTSSNTSKNIRGLIITLAAVAAGVGLFIALIYVLRVDKSEPVVWFSTPVEPLNLSVNSDFLIDPALIGSQEKMAHCQEMREPHKEDLIQSFVYNDDRLSIQTNLNHMDENLECYTHQEIAAAQAKWHKLQAGHLVTRASECIDGGAHMTSVSRWNEFPKPLETASGKMRLWEPDADELHQQYVEIMGWNLQCHHQATSYIKAIEMAGEVENEYVQKMIRLTAVKNFYMDYYQDELGAREHPDQVEAIIVFSSNYPLVDFWDPIKIAEELRKDSGRRRPIPLAFAQDNGLTLDELEDVICSQFRYEYNSKIDDLAAAYVEAGYDESYAYNMAMRAHIDDNHYADALRLAHEHLGAKQIRYIEDQRIAMLERTGQYSIAISPSGQRMRVFPMYN